MAEKINLTVDTGSMLVSLKDKQGREIGEFEFIPTDSGLLDRYEKVVDFFNNANFKESLTGDESTKEMQNFAKDIHAQFDYLFGAEVSDGIFKKCGALTLLPNGDMYFENVLDGIAKLIEDVMDKRVKKKLAKIKSATSKYHA